MSIWRVTGNPENWITALQKKAWAVNEKNKNKKIWEYNIKPNDTIIFHSSTKSDIFKKPRSSIIGFGFVGDYLYKKQKYWWIQEVKDKKNYWPYVIPLKEIYIFSDTTYVNFDISVEEKSKETLIKEIEIILDKALPLKKLNEIAKNKDTRIPYFPTQGSISRVNNFYEIFILNDYEDYYNLTPQSEYILENKLYTIGDTFYEKISKEDALKTVLEFRDSDSYGYRYTTSSHKIRKESIKQKRLIAKIENYTCQLCGYYYEYINLNKKKSWIYDVDHIIPKAEGGTEESQNLWVLCPNCHRKKTNGIIKIDLQNNKIYEKEKEIQINSDNHLFFKKI